MNVLDLFSGIGNFSLGLERAGFRTVAFCEADPYCRKILEKHWPNVPCYDDVRTLTAARLAADGISVDAVCGGFPCQDISLAGKGAGIDGERSGLWTDYARIVGELNERRKIKFVFVENVAALLGRGLDRVLRDLAAIGFDAEWHCIPAAALGAPHFRDRLWIVAYPHTDSLRSQGVWSFAPGAWREQQFEGLLQDSIRVSVPTGKSGGVVDGAPSRSHRLKALGNSIVPQIPELIGRAVMTHTIGKGKV